MERVLVREWVLLLPIGLSIFITAGAVFWVGEAQKAAEWSDHRAQHYAEMYVTANHNFEQCVEAFRDNKRSLDENKNSIDESKKSLDLIRAKIQEW